MLRNILLILCFFSLCFPQSALQRKIKEDKERKAQEEISAISKDLEVKIRKLEEERKRLEELKKPEPKVEEKLEIKKLVEIFNKASPDEAGAIMNNLEPRLAAEILLNLKERQASAILEAMDPQKAAEVATIIMKSKRK